VIAPSKCTVRRWNSYCASCFALWSFRWATKGQKKENFISKFSSEACKARTPLQTYPALFTNALRFIFCYSHCRKMSLVSMHSAFPLLSSYIWEFPPSFPTSSYLITANGRLLHCGNSVMSLANCGKLYPKRAPYLRGHMFWLVKVCFLDERRYLHNRVRSFCGFPWNSKLIHQMSSYFAPFQNCMLDWTGQRSLTPWYSAVKLINTLSIWNWLFWWVSNTVEAIFYFRKS